nr:glucan 1,3-beta-glucosidase [Quercus suber]
MPTIIWLQRSPTIAQPGFLRLFISWRHGGHVAPVWGLLLRFANAVCNLLIHATWCQMHGRSTLHAVLYAQRTGHQDCSRMPLDLLTIRTALSPAFVGQTLDQCYCRTKAKFKSSYVDPVMSNVTAKQPSTAAIHATSGSCSYWMENIAHRGIAAFNSNPSGYKVFRNVKDYGAKGDGGKCRAKPEASWTGINTDSDTVTDDTAAINAAIADGNRCTPGSCASSTTTPAVVYFPAGTYLITSSIVDYYYTQLIGNPNCLPTIKAAGNFATKQGYLGMIDGDPYTSQYLAYGSTNVFFRQIRNFIIDTTAASAGATITGIHWPTSQATSLQNIVFNMPTSSGTKHQGVFIEEGSAGFIGDLIFNGGMFGLNVGNQQFTMRNLTFNHNVVGINQLWDWDFTYRGLTFNNVGTAISMNSGSPNSLSVGTMTIIDSSFNNVQLAVANGKTSGSSPPQANNLILENLSLNNCPIVVKKGDGSTALAGTTGRSTVTAWGQGNAYTISTGPKAFAGSIPGAKRPSSLLTGTNFYSRSKPQYQNQAATNIVSARASGAKGDGTTDDTKALQSAINSAASAGKVLYVDHGDYVVTSTLVIPPGSKIVGESYSVILSSGSFFNNMNSPKPVVQIGNAGQSGSIEWSDMIVSTKGAQAGAILIQYNLASSAGAPSGIWDVHTRIGGFTGSQLQRANCPTSTPPTNTACISAYMSMHITPQSAGLLMENNWLWVADHDMDDSSLTQINVYSGRGLLVQSKTGPIWLSGTAVEHHALYQYQFAGASNIFAGLIQTETAYYQPKTDATTPFPAVSSLSDPTFTGPATVQDNNTAIPNRNGWGLRIVGSSSVLVYGADHYSFFNSYSTACSAQNSGETCQTSIVDLEGTNTDLTIYNLVSVGTHWPLSINGKVKDLWNNGYSGFSNNMAWFTTSS